MLPICSNIPFEGSLNCVSEAPNKESANPQFTVGVFSSFGSEICDLLEPVLPGVLENPSTRVVLIGPAHSFVESLTTRFPGLAGRITSMGRVQASRAGPYFQCCDLLLQLFPDGACAARGTTELRIAFTPDRLGITVAAAGPTRVYAYEYDYGISPDLRVTEVRDCATSGPGRASSRSH